MVSHRTIDTADGTESITLELPALQCTFDRGMNPGFGLTDNARLVDEAFDLIGVPVSGSRRSYTHGCRFYEWICAVYPIAEKQDLQPWLEFTVPLTVLAELGKKKVADPAFVRDLWIDLGHAISGFHDPAVATPRAGTTHTALPETLMTAVAGMVAPAASHFRQGILAAIERQLTSQVTHAAWDNAPTDSPLMSLSLQDFLDFRIDNYSTPLYTLGIPHLNRARLSTDLYTDPRYHRADRLATTHMTLVNDLYSLRKEVALDFDDLAATPNLVVYNVLHTGMSWQRALDDVVDRVRAVEHDYIRLRESWLAADNSASLRAALRGYEYMMAGNLYYMLTSPHYQGRGSQGIYAGGQIVLSKADSANF
ncbi:terpene synthase family protein [Nocardia thraciensis]